MAAWTNDGWPHGPMGHPLVACGPSGTGGPHDGNLQNFLGLFDMIPEKPELFRNPKINLPYMNPYLRTLLELLVISRISSEILNQYSFTP